MVQSIHFYCTFESEFALLERRIIEGDFRFCTFEICFALQ